ncbi:MAG: hypothetical protein JWQ71_2941 [Pedosphaera sp.]|nr:hypothetical protein [Pedosphaera sp.]
MKKIFAILIVCIAVGGIYFFVRAKVSEKQNVQQSERQVFAKNITEKPGAEPTLPTAVAVKPVAPPVSAPPTDASPKPTASKPITHTAADFVKGEFDNIVLNNALHLGNDATPTTFQNKYKLYGLFHSLPEDLSTTFNKVIPSYQGTIPEGGALGFWIRTRTSDGTWSTWIEVGAENMNQPIMLESPATSWQYRLTFFANDTATSPNITSVTVGTEVPPLANNAPDDDPGRGSAK